jgi:ABC-type siderophore export system fused ATPase/permease subunit
MCVVGMRLELRLGNMLVSVQAFTSLSLFTVLRMPLFQLPQLISQVINARVALNRIQAFLAADEQPDLPLQPPVPQGGHALPQLACLCCEAEVPGRRAPVCFMPDIPQP